MIKNTVLIAFLVFALFAPCANGENTAEDTGAAVLSLNGAAPVRLAQAQQSGAADKEWKPGLQTGQNAPPRSEIPQQNLTPMDQGMGNMSGMPATSGTSAATVQQNTMPMTGPGMGMGGMGMGGMGMGGMGMGGMGMGGNGMGCMMGGMGNMPGMGMGNTTGTTGNAGTPGSTGTTVTTGATGAAGGQ